MNKKQILNYVVVFSLVISTIISCKKDDAEPKKDPKITWENPTDIEYGTLLSDKELNATADVDGTFSYTPAIGTKLEIGTDQEIKVDFTPTDITKYNSINKTIKINVFVFGTVTDYDGNVYKTITIGNQTWMAENLRSTHYSDGTTIPDVVAYNNKSENISKYGLLYTWDAAMKGSVAEKTQGVSPVGWHIPSDAEWIQLENYLGGSNIAGGKMKTRANWNSPNVGASNISGFSALPAGEYDAHQFIKFQLLNQYAVFWTSTEISNELARERWLFNGDEKSSIYDWFKTMKYSIRCIKN